MPILRKLRTFGKLEGAQRWAFFEAVVLLAFARLLVTFVPLSRWRSQIAASDSNDTLDPDAQKVALMVRRAVNQVDRNSPVEFVCLPQALTARWMLARRGISSRLFIGTKLEAKKGREFHAWLKVGEVMVTGDCNESEYAVFGSTASN